jgi:hypothetical protein
MRKKKNKTNLSSFIHRILLVSFSSIGLGFHLFKQTKQQQKQKENSYKEIRNKFYDKFIINIYYYYKKDKMKNSVSTKKRKELIIIKIKKQ